MRTATSLVAVLIMAAAAVVLSGVLHLASLGVGGAGSPEPGFIGRSESVAPMWKQTFADDFLNLTKGPDFLAKYPDWTAYGPDLKTTGGQQNGVNKGDHYGVSNITVRDTGGLRVLNCRLLPASITSDRKNWGAAPIPRFDVGLGQARATSMKLEMRVRITSQAAGWHIANLLWFDDEKWPYAGEIDFWEQLAPNLIGANFHNHGAVTGADSVPFNTTVAPTTWHIIGFEFVGGKSYKQFLDGKEIGSTTSRVPTTPARLVLQNEPDGKPVQPINVQYDWITVWTAR